MEGLSPSTWMDFELPGNASFNVLTQLQTPWRTAACFLSGWLLLMEKYVQNGCIL